VNDHFVDVNKTIPMPKEASKDILDMILTRYARYLIAQNGDSRKEDSGGFWKEEKTQIELRYCASH
jgi:hypothetical protein